MRKEFCEYYPPSDKEYRTLWEEGLIVLDANVLLDLYRLPNTARKNLLDVLSHLSSKLWIPHQVALEFQRNRPNVVAEFNEKVHKSRDAIREAFQHIKKVMLDLELDKRELDLNCAKLLSDMDASSAAIETALDLACKNQLAVTDKDPIRESIDALHVGKVGDGPASQSELDLLLKDAAKRYADSTPPGFLDAKSKDVSFTYNGLKYEVQYGDVILWRQLLDTAKERKARAVMFVTSDEKEDWWWIKKGRKMGPRPELARELMRASGVDIFWMYTLREFLRKAEKYTSVDVLEGTLDEVGVVANYRAQKELLEKWEADLAYHYPRTPQEVESAVYNWLVALGYSVTKTSEFPFLVTSDDGLYAYQVKYTYSLHMVPQDLFDSLGAGIVAIHEGRIAGCCFVVVTEPAQVAPNSPSLPYFRACLPQILKKAVNTSVIIGTIVNGLFQPV